MGSCLSKKTCPSSSSQSVKSPDPNKTAIEKSPKQETEAQEPKPQENGKARKEVFVIKHRRSHERSKTTDPEDSEEKSTSSNHNPVDVDAILIQCGRLSRSNSDAAKTNTRRYSGSKRSFDLECDADAEGGGEEEEAERRQRQRGRRRTPSREREDSKSYRSGSRERRVSRSPRRRQETNPNSDCCVNSRPGRFLSVPATDKGEASIKRITVKRNVGEGATRKAASPNRRSPLGEIDPNSVAYPPPSQGNKRMMKTENGNHKLESQNSKTATQAPNCEIVSSSGTQLVKPRSRSLGKSRDFDFSPEALLSNNNKNGVSTLPSYTALLLQDIQNFHHKIATNSSISKAVADLNSATKQHQRREFDFTSKTADLLMEPNFNKYVSVKRGSWSLEEQESSGSNSFKGSSGVVEHSSAESTYRASLRSSNKERDRSPLGLVKPEFDPLNKGRARVALVDDSSALSL